MIYYKNVKFSVQLQCHTQKIVENDKNFKENTETKKLWTRQKCEKFEKYDVANNLRM